MADTVWTRDKRIRSASLTMGQTFYLVTLNQFIGNNPDAWPSQQKLANVMNASKRGVQKWQEELEAAGVITVDVGQGRSSTNRYRMNLDALQPKRIENDEHSAPFRAMADEQMTNPVRSNDEHSAREMTNTVRTERTVERTKKEQAFSFPEKLNNEEFKTAWDQWVQHRREIKKPLTPSTVSKQLARLATFGSANAIRSIENSIANGWRGVFDPDQRTGRSSGNTEASQAWQKTLEAVRIHSSHRPSEIERDIGPTAWRALKAIGGAKQVDKSNEFERRELEKRFIQAFSEESYS